MKYSPGTNESYFPERLFVDRKTVVSTATEQVKGVLIWGMSVSKFARAARH
jgi:hypothetical protein